MKLSILPPACGSGARAGAGRVAPLPRICLDLLPLNCLHPGAWAGKSGRAGPVCLHAPPAPSRPSPCLELPASPNPGHLADSYSFFKTLLWKKKKKQPCFGTTFIKLWHHPPDKMHHFLLCTLKKKSFITENFLEDTKAEFLCTTFARGCALSSPPVTRAGKTPVPALLFRATHGTWHIADEWVSDGTEMSRYNAPILQMRKPRPPAHQRSRCSLLF